MSGKTKIEWATHQWNPVTGCTKVSQGCRFCYAEREWPRLAAPRTLPNIYTGRAFTDVKCHPEKLNIPLRWTKPRRIFVNSMSDLFHEDVPFRFIDRVFAVMAMTSSHGRDEPHIFQILTKRPRRMLEYMTMPTRAERVFDAIKYFANASNENELAGCSYMKSMSRFFLLPNVWLGVSVEDQATADERIPLLLQTPAAVRWISAEPLMGPIYLSRWLLARDIGWANAGGPNECRHGYADGVPCPQCPKLSWVVVGGESGPKARPMHPDWVRSLRDQCQAAGVPFFFKQWGEYSHTGNGNPSRYIHASKLNDGLWHKDADGVIPVWRVGKKSAGRTLDGRTWDEYPA